MKNAELKTTGKRSYPAPCNLYEEDGKVVLTLEMPGVSKDGLDVRIDNDQLIIHGTKALPETAGSYRIREIRDGDYHLEYTIDDTIDRNKVDAVMNKGILTLTLHLKEAVKPRKIKVLTK